jgi:hypothetical protein
MEQIEKLLREVDKEFVKGHSVADICSHFGISESTLQTLVDHYSVPPNVGETLTNCRLLDAVFPVFYAANDESPLEQIGSGVLLQIGGEIFALTAAHVTDQLAMGTLFMPAVDGIKPIAGYHSYNPPPPGRSRDADKADMAYYRLGPELRKELHPLFKPASIADLAFSDDLNDGDLFTYAGYPWRKSRRREGIQESERVTFTGHVVLPDVYERLQYNHRVHIVARMRLKKMYSHLHRSRKRGPHPQGISGGAVLSWPRTFRARSENPELKIAGIAHTFHPKDHCMVATRVIPYVMAIVRNNPSLESHLKDMAEER